MSKILLALAILSAGAGGFLATRHSTTQLAHETNANRETWQVQTQQLAAVQREQADLSARLREVKASVAHFQPVPENELWSVLRTNRDGNLEPELRERVLEELGFNWQFSPDFIVVTKQAVRDTGGWMLRSGPFPDAVAATLAMTPAERGQVEATMQQAQRDFNDWALAHVERREPQGDLLAHYFLPGDPAMVQSISNNIAVGLLTALGRERVELMQRSARDWMHDNVDVRPKGATLLIWRELVGNEARLQVGTRQPAGGNAVYLPEFPMPATFRPIFPNGWADVAKREGFELPPNPQKK